MIQDCGKGHTTPSLYMDGVLGSSAENKGWHQPQLGTSDTTRYIRSISSNCNHHKGNPLAMTVLQEVRQHTDTCFISLLARLAMRSTDTFCIVPRYPKHDKNVKFPIGHGPGKEVLSIVHPHALPDCQLVQQHQPFQTAISQLALSYSHSRQAGLVCILVLVIALDPICFHELPNSQDEPISPGMLLVLI